MSDAPAVKRYLDELQERISTSIEARDTAKFLRDPWLRAEGGGGETRVLSDGHLFERAGVSVSHVFGQKLPPSASNLRPQIVGAPFQAMGLSLVFHPRNPHVPTTHCNVRFIEATPADAAPVWWFGGGFDLTPFYPVGEDVVHWHTVARDLCTPYGADVYPRYKKWCDEYFYLKHREETRGVGGLFYDDLNEGGFERCFAFTRDVGQGLLDAYLPIVARRKDTPYGDRKSVV